MNNNSTFAKMPWQERRKECENPILDLFLKRWSPRAMDGKSMPQEELLRLFEAARWAPSSFNEQEWRFLYAHRETPNWKLFFDLLVKFNQEWCEKAAVLACIISRRTYEKNNKSNRVHAFDTGAAYENLALQGAELGYVVHAIGGFDVEKAVQVLEIPETYSIQAMFAVGNPAPIETLPESLRENETPSGRKPLTQITHEGPFPKECWR